MDNANFKSDVMGSRGDHVSLCSIPAILHLKKKTACLYCIYKQPFCNCFLSKPSRLRFQMFPSDIEHRGYWAVVLTRKTNTTVKNISSGLNITSSLSEEIKEAKPIEVKLWYGEKKIKLCICQAADCSLAQLITSF